MSGAEKKIIGMDTAVQPPCDLYVQKEAARLRCAVVIGAITGFSFKDFLTLAPEGDIDLTRNPDTGRDVEL